MDACEFIRIKQNNHNLVVQVAQNGFKIVDYGNKCHSKMCGTGDSGIIKSRTHELILFNVTYENVKISYTFMVNFYVLNRDMT